MFCTYCKLARPENDAPCPNCGAPSSLLGNYQNGGWGSVEPVSTAWNASAPSFNQQRNDQVPQVPFAASMPSPAESSWQQNPGFQNQSMPQQQRWGSYAMAQPQQQQQQGPPSLLPVPYTGNVQEGNQQSPMQLAPLQYQQQMLPALPDEQQETVYVPPMYTKPRPIIPRYRIISGILSILVVALLLCGGSVYYAQATGKLTAFQRMMGTAPLPNTNTSTLTIPDPPDRVDMGPARDIITSATTTSFIDPQSLTPREQDKIFKVNTTFYVTYSANLPGPGTIVIKWYMNGQHYRDNSSFTRKPSIKGALPMVYVAPAVGIVELYWMKQGGPARLAQRLYFAVR